MVVSFVNAGLITFVESTGVIMGANIGTTVTANIAAIIGNVYAKRAARFHFVFNVFGVIWMLILMQPFLIGIDNVMGYFLTDADSVLQATDQIGRANATLALSLFHTTFNVINVLLLFAFVPRLVRFVEKYQKEKPGADSTYRLQYISSGMMSSPELSISQAHKEVELFAKLIEKMHFSIQGLLFKKQNKQEQFLKKIKKREEITDTIELEIAEYLTKISSYNLTETATRRIRGIHSMINDLERIGDIYYQMSKTFERMQNEGTMLNEDSMEGIRKMLNLIHEAIRNVRDNLEKDSENIDLEKAMEIENAINDYQDKLLEYHYNQLENKVYSN